MGWCVLKGLKKVSGKKQTPKDRTLFHSRTQTHPIYIYRILYIYIYMYLYIYIYIHTHIIYHIQPFFRENGLFMVIQVCDPPNILLPQLRGPGKPPWRFPPGGSTRTYRSDWNLSLPKAWDGNRRGGFFWLTDVFTLKSDSCWDTSHSVGKKGVQHGIHNPCGSLGEVQFFKKKNYGSKVVSPHLGTHPQTFTNRL